MERFAEDADLIGGLRERMWTRGRLVTTRPGGAEESEGAKFADYFDFAEAFTTLPSHRILAVFRGEKEEVLDVALEPDTRPADAGGADRLRAHHRRRVRDRRPRPPGRPVAGRGRCAGRGAPGS